MDWFVTDTTVASVMKLDSITGWVTARKAGYAVLVARWQSALSAAVIVIENVAVEPRSAYMTQVVGGISNYVAGKPLFVQAILTADSTNDWHPVATVTEGRPWGRDTLYTIPMDVPDKGIPTSLEWDDYELVDSTFRATIAADSVKPGFFNVTLDWNTPGPQEKLGQFCRGLACGVG